MLHNFTNPVSFVTTIGHHCCRWLCCCCCGGAGGGRRQRQRRCSTPPTGTTTAQTAMPTAVPTPARRGPGDTPTDTPTAMGACAGGQSGWGMKGERCAFGAGAFAMPPAERQNVGCWVAARLLCSPSCPKPGPPMPAMCVCAPACRGAPAPAPAVDTDALYQQQLAYALAASQRDTTRTPLPAANDDELSRAIQASLQVGWVGLGWLGGHWGWRDGRAACCVALCGSVPGGGVSL